MVLKNRKRAISIGWKMLLESAFVKGKPEEEEEERLDAIEGSAPWNLSSENVTLFAILGLSTQL